MIISSSFVLFYFLYFFALTEILKDSSLVVSFSIHCPLLITPYFEFCFFLMWFFFLFFCWFYISFDFFVCLSKQLGLLKNFLQKFFFLNFLFTQFYYFFVLFDFFFSVLLLNLLNVYRRNVSPQHETFPFFDFPFSTFTRHNAKTGHIHLNLGQPYHPCLSTEDWLIDAWLIDRSMNKGSKHFTVCFYK